MQKIVHETDNADEVNALWNSKEWSKPIWSESTRQWKMVRKVFSLK